VLHLNSSVVLTLCNVTVQYSEMPRCLLFNDCLLCCVETVMTAAAVTIEPLTLERLEVVESAPEPTAVDAAEVTVVTNELLTSDDVVES